MATARRRVRWVSPRSLARRVFEESSVGSVLFALCWRSVSEEVVRPRTVRLPVGAPAGASVHAGATPARTVHDRPLELLRAGAIVGGYELVRPIARGAAGAVFLARDLRLGRRVAIKLMVSSDAVLVRRFLVEAQATARCVHENIVVIHEVGSWMGVPFLVLEYLDGPALSAVLATAPLPLARALELIVPVVRALECAHQADIVHRDLKPDNIIVTRRGVVKVVDFGIAKAFARDPVESAGDSGLWEVSSYETLSGPGLVVGTLPYMAPEQWRGLDVDARCDLFAVGVILYRMLTGRHPCGSLAPRALREAALAPQPYPSLAAQAPELPAAVARLVDRCLRKHPTDRYGTASELRAELEALVGSQRRAATTSDDCPFPGLAQFTAHDASRYFGREREVTAALAILERAPVLAVVGPSGSGKSSLALAGVAPAARRALGACRVTSLRPGRAPLAALIELAVAVGAAAAGLEARLAAEPGALGVVLREAARARGESLLVVIDQLEEVFTLTSDGSVRRAFIDALLGAADDLSSPVRLVLTLRSDFLHRVAEHPWLTEVVGDGLLLLRPPDREGLRVALTRPLALAGYELEDEALCEEIVRDLEGSTAPLPLLQLVGTELWARRDRSRRRLGRQSYRELGGVHGALAGQADAVLAGLSPAGRKLVRGMVLRLVTSQGTRAVVDREELVASSPEASAVLASLVAARLVLVHDDDGTVELIHEALIEQWPALRGWLDESRVDFALRERLIGAARQWDEAGRPDGLLWAGEVLDDVRALLDHEVPLGARERAFAGASRAAASRAARRRRLLLTSALVASIAVALGSMGGLAAVRRAEGAARAQTAIAQDEARRARAAEHALSEKIELLEREERERLAAQSAAAQSRELAEQRQGEVERSRQDLEVALRDAQGAQRQAEDAARQARELAARERAARDQLEAALERERERVEQLRRQRSMIEQSL